MKAEFAGRRPPGATMDDVLREFEPLLAGVVAVARGNDLYRADIEALFPFLEEHGWRLTGAVRRIWQGQRDLYSLMEGLDLQDSLIVNHLLELLKEPGAADPLTALPASVRAAVATGEVAAVNRALDTLAQDQAQAIVRQLLDSGVVSRPDPTAADPDDALLPPAVVAALEAENMAALQLAVDALPAEEAQAILNRLEEAQVIGVATTAADGVNVDELLRRFEPLLQAVAAVARSVEPDPQLQREIEEALEQLEENGWSLTVPVQQLWSGQRDADRLTAGMDEPNARLVRRLLELLDIG